MEFNASRHHLPRFRLSTAADLCVETVSVASDTTNLGVLDVVPGGLKLVELADGVTEAEFRAATEATLVN